METVLTTRPDDLSKIRARNALKILLDVHGDFGARSAATSSGRPLIIDQSKIVILISRGIEFCLLNPGPSSCECFLTENTKRSNRSHAAFIFLNLFFPACEAHDLSVHVFLRHQVSPYRDSLELCTPGPRRLKNIAPHLVADHKNKN